MDNLDEMKANISTHADTDTYTLHWNGIFQKESRTKDSFFEEKKTDQVVLPKTQYYNREHSRKKCQRKKNSMTRCSLLARFVMPIVISACYCSLVICLCSSHYVNVDLFLPFRQYRPKTKAYCNNGTCICNMHAHTSFVTVSLNKLSC